MWIVGGTIAVIVWEHHIPVWYWCELDWQAANSNTSRATTDTGDWYNIAAGGLDM